MTSSNPSSRRHFLAGNALALALPLACISGAASATDQVAGSTRDVLDHHLGAFAQGLDELMRDYGPTSVILTHDKAYRGLDAIRGFFDAFLKSAKPEFWEAFRITAQTVDGEIAYLVWHARPFIGIATDTLLIRNGKIVVQTFTAA